MRQVAIVLPPREVFSPAATGAVGLVVHLMARAGAWPATVFGMATAAPFSDVTFRAVRPGLLPVMQSRRYAASVARMLRRAPADLIEVHNRPDTALLLARAFPSVPVTLFLHNDPQGMRGARTAAERAALPSRLAAVVTVSDYLRRRFARTEGIAVLPNGIDLAALPVARREPVVLFAGRVVADKGADVFIRAAARALPALPGWRAELIGADRFGAASPETPFLRTLRAEAAVAGIAMPGWQPHAAVLAAMARAAIVVVPSRWPEPFGLTALEAMGSGAALLCSPRGGLPEVTGDAALPIDPDDPAALAAAIIGLARDPPRLAALGAAGRARAAQFDIGPVGARLDALRRQALAAWPRTAPHPI